MIHTYLLREGENRHELDARIPSEAIVLNFYTHDRSMAVLESDLKKALEHGDVHVGIYGKKIPKNAIDLSSFVREHELDHLHPDIRQGHLVRFFLDDGHVKVQNLSNAATLKHHGSGQRDFPADKPATLAKLLHLIFSPVRLSIGTGAVGTPLIMTRKTLGQHRERPA